MDISMEYVLQLDDHFTAQAFITTDVEDNQITAFHPGAMSNAHEQKVPESGITLGLISPDGRDGMLQHAEQFAAQGIPFIFDPGQGMPMFDGDDLKRFLELATYVTVNDYESEMLRNKAGLSIEETVAMVETYIVTRGARGSRIHTGGKVLEIPSARPKALSDPTGCGDAYRAGLIYGLQNDLDWETTGRVASLMGAIKIEQPGTQNHSFTFDEFAARFKREFDMALG
jgi:adenosine kinase